MRDGDDSSRAVSFELTERCARALDAASGLSERLSALRLCVDLLLAHGHVTSAGELQRALMRATMALRVLREELTTVEIVDRYMRVHGGDGEHSS